MKRFAIVFVVVALASTLTWAAASAQASASMAIVITNPVTLGPPPDFLAVGPFTATGPVCPSGTSTNTLRQVLRTTPTSADLLATKRFVCADGTGTFDIALVVHLELAPFSDNFVWAIVRDTGAYDDLHAIGRGTGVPQLDGTILDTYTGRTTVSD